MFKVFTYENLKEVENKKPLICYSSSNGACGPSGLFLVVFDDGSIYGYSTYYENSDKELIADIIATVPETYVLLSLFKKVGRKPKRRSYLMDMRDYDLGLGNMVLLNKSINERFNFPSFWSFLKEEYNVNVSDIIDIVNEAINNK